MTATDTPVRTTPIKTSLPPEFLHDGEAGGEPLATFLGLFSIGLGLWETLAPGSVADATGVRYPGILRVYGLREIAAGLGILGNRRPAAALWARVAGDVLDLAAIGAAYAQARGDDRRKALVAGAAVLGVTALDVIAAGAHSRA